MTSSEQTQLWGILNPNQSVMNCIKQYKVSADIFKKTFGVSLKQFWTPLFGFDIVKFDSYLCVPDNTSLEQYLKDEYSEDACELVRSLL